MLYRWFYFRKRITALPLFVTRNKFVLLASVMGYHLFLMIYVFCSLQFHRRSSLFAQWAHCLSTVISHWCSCIFLCSDSVRLCCPSLSLLSSHEQNQLWLLELLLFLEPSFPIIRWMMKVFRCKPSRYDITRTILCIDQWSMQSFF